MTNSHPILFFDGVCNLCNSTVDFIIKKDRQAIFKFAALQSDSAKQLLSNHPIDANDLDTVILLYQGKVYQKAAAAIQVMKILKGIYGPIGTLAALLPLAVSNRIYDWVAANRYRLYGQRETCRIPTAAERDRFLA